MSNSALKHIASTKIAPLGCASAALVRLTIQGTDDGRKPLPKLYQCRTSLREVADHFGAQQPPPTDWAAELWPYRRGLVVRNTSEGRRIQTMLWGIVLPSQSRRRYNPEGAPPTLFLSEIWRDDRELLEPENRCLIVLDRFAIPDGPKGARTRTWFGYDERPIFGWAGVWRTDGFERFAGIQVDAAEDMEFQRIMPAIIGPDEYETWLTGSIAAAMKLAGRRLSSAGLYREPTDQPWGADRT